MKTTNRCQAYLLTRDSRKWHKDTGRSIRCTFKTKSIVDQFCGNHAYLASIISEIVWFNEEGTPYDGE